MRAKGTRYERELKHLLEAKGFFVTRSSGSGADGISPDLIVLHTTKKFAIECKAWKRALRLAPEKVTIMSEWQHLTGLPVYIAWRMRKGWRFFPIDALTKTSSTYVLRCVEHSSGLSLEELLK